MPMVLSDEIEGERSRCTHPRPLLAFLGPMGTYSHQAAYDRFADSVEYSSKRTISDVFDSLGTDGTSIAVLPQENSIHGIVIETYDILRSSDLGITKWIRGSVTLAVQHSLVVRKGQTLRDIKRVLSHEQALGQCQRFLKQHLPSASLVRTPSTAAAAESISTDPEARNAAAICSSFCLKMFPELSVLHEGIQDEQDNFTRFYIASDSETSALPQETPDDERSGALLRIHNDIGPQAISIADVLAAIVLPIARIDRRPSLSPGCFKSTYLVEIFNENTILSEQGATDRPTKSSWTREVHKSIEQVQSVGARVTLLGIW